MFRVEFYDDYNNIDETMEFSSIDEVEKAVTNKVKEGFDYNQIKVMEEIEFKVEVKATVIR